MKRRRIKNKERKGLARLEQEMREGKKAVNELLHGISKERRPSEGPGVSPGLIGSD